MAVAWLHDIAEARVPLLAKLFGAASLAQRRDERGVDTPEQVGRQGRRDDAVDAHDAVRTQRVRDRGAAVFCRGHRADGH